MRGSTIVLDAEALAALKRMQPIDERTYDQRPDGRYELRVSDRLRSQLDAFVVKHGINYSTAVKVIEQLTPRA